MANATIQDVRDYMQSDNSEFTDGQINFYLGMANKIVPTIVTTTDTELLKYLEAAFTAYLLIYNRPEVRGYSGNGNSTSIGKKIRIGRISIDNSKSVSSNVKDMIALANFYYDQFATFAESVSLTSDIANEMDVTTPSDYVDETYDNITVDGRHYDYSDDIINPETTLVYNNEKRWNT